MANFPHMSDTNFPNIEQVDVWKLRNDFPYKDFDNPQMRITVCKVPWDVGLIHVGNAQIGGLGNVVDFGSAENRDSWFDSLSDKHVFETEYRAFHMQGASGAIDGKIKLQIPYDVMAHYNYAIVEYYPMPVALEGMGVSKWFYFVRESHMKAPNTTEVELILDAWATFLPGIELKIPFMMLERGHAPMHALSADDYLANPLENTRYVTGQDITFDASPSIVKHDTEIVFNDGDNIYACLVIDSSITGNWGAYRDNWKMPTTHRLTNQGTPNYTCFCLPAGEFNSFISEVDSSFPQFKQAVKAVFFASDKMISLGDAFTFFNRTFHYAMANAQTRDLLSLDKGKFGYDSKYADIAKLYTYPYAHIEILDEMGNASIIRIEDTTGKLEICTSFSTVFPYINLTANVLGVGSGNARNISFKNMSNRSMKFGGHWQEITLNWDVPTFAVVQSNDITNDYATWFDRIQRGNDATTAKANANASAATVKTNADNLASTDKANADSTARTIKANADNSAATAKTNADLLADAAKANADADANTLVANVALDVAANNENKSNRQSLNNQSADTDISSNTVSTNLANDLTRDLVSISTAAERESASIAAVGGYMGAALSLSPAQALGTTTSLLQSGVSIHASQSEASAQISNNSSQLGFSNLYNASRNAFANAEMGFETTTENNRITGQAANSAATAKANATRTQTSAKQTAANTKQTDNTNAANTLNNDLTVNANTYNTATTNNANAKNTADANAQRAYDNSLEAISNDVKQAALKPTNTFGMFSNGETATTRPMAVFAQVVTQNDGAIAAAGDEMLRFGYHCNMQWEFDGWSKMKNFTYWKVSDLWFDDFNLPDAYADRIRFLLMGGVCVWRSPDIMGKTSIYDN